MRGSDSWWRLPSSSSRVLRPIKDLRKKCDSRKPLLPAAYRTLPCPRRTSKLPSALRAETCLYAWRWELSHTRARTWRHRQDGFTANGRLESGAESLALTFRQHLACGCSPRIVLRRVRFLGRTSPRLPFESDHIPAVRKVCRRGGSSAGRCVERPQTLLGECFDRVLVELSMGVFLSLYCRIRRCLPTSRGVSQVFALAASRSSDPDKRSG